MPKRKLNRMNEKRNRLETELLAAREVGAASGSLPEHRHDSGAEHFYNIEEIHLRAETVTPLLRQILDFEPYWGINE